MRQSPRASSVISIVHTAVLTMLIYLIVAILIWTIGDNQQTIKWLSHDFQCLLKFSEQCEWLYQGLVLQYLLVFFFRFAFHFHSENWFFSVNSFFSFCFRLICEHCEHFFDGIFFSFIGSFVHFMVVGTVQLERKLIDDMSRWMNGRDNGITTWNVAMNNYIRTHINTYPPKTVMCGKNDVHKKPDQSANVSLKPINLTHNSMAN